MSVLDKFLDVMGFSEVKNEEYEQEEAPTLGPSLELGSSRKTRGQIIPLNSNKEQIKVVLLEPMNFEDCQQIADNLKNKRTVIINVENLELGLARRIIDFVGGTAYALGGTLQKIGSGIIIAAPHNVDISGDMSAITQPKELFAWINKINETPDLRRY